MSSVQVAIPMLRGKRRFHVEKGRRWSVVEHLMLDAVVQRPSTAAELSHRSSLPRRIVVEAFIRLMRVGWVELTAGERGPLFAATAAGKQQSEAGELHAVTSMRGRWMSFAVDQVAGNVFRGREIFVHNPNKLTKAPEADALVYLNRTPRYVVEDQGAIFGALEGEDEIIVGTDPAPERLYDGYAVVTVSDGIIEGLPPRANEELRIAITRKALEAAPPGAKTASPPATLSVPPPALEHRAIDALFDHTDLLLGGESHKSTLEHVLRVARDRVLIHSTFISPEGWDEVMPLLLGAAARGTTVQILWGQADDREKNSSSRVAAVALSAAIAASGRSDLVLVHPFTTGSHAKILFGDDGQGNWTAVVGSCNWLSANFDTYEASVRLRDPKLVGETIRHVAALSLGSDGVWNQVAGSLTALGRRIESIPRGGGRTAKVKLLLAPDHSALLLEARDRAAKRIVVTSHRIGIAGRPIVILPALAAARARNVEAQLYYGRPTGPLSGLDTAQLAAEFASKGVDIRPVHRPRLHAKTLAWDDDHLAVTSQNWLSADPTEDTRLREIGVLIELNKIADNFVRRFEQARAAQQV